VRRATNLQRPHRPAPSTGETEWLEGGLLDGATRRAVGSINLAFLNLAAELAEEGRLRQIPGLPSRAIDALVDPVAGPRLCEHLPYVLFDFRFADGNFWTPEIAAACESQYAVTRRAAEDGIVAFARAAVMVVWHLAQARPAATRLVFGASPTTIAAVAVMPVAVIDRLAHRIAPALTARFGVHTRFWLQFESYASRPDERSLNLLRQLGLQIEGAESARHQSLQRHHWRSVA